MAKVLVFRGSKEKTVGGMTASSLTKNKTGKIVSKKKSALGKKNTWMIAFQKARKALKIKGFVAVKKGTELYKKKSALGKKNTWMIAVQKARKALKIKGFVAVKRGTELYKKAKEFQ